VSSRVNEPHVAEQLSAVVVLPLLVLFLAQVVGLVILNRELIVALAGALLIVDAVLFRLATRLFDRETILTRWG
jgi:ABC-2 type transport system permease protein